MKKFLSAIIFGTAVAASALAVPAYPGKVKITQPDGSVVTVRVHGDEYLHWTTSEDGPAVRPTLTAVSKAQEARERAESARKSPAVKSVSGEHPYLVILTEFADLSFVIPDARAAFDDMLNKEGYSDYGGTGSVRDYYVDNSHGRFNPRFDVVGPYKLSGKMSKYTEDDGMTTDGVPAMTVEACRGLDDTIDFSRYDVDGDGYVDNVAIIFPGYNAAYGVEGTIWPHQWVVQSDVTLDGVRLSGYMCSSELTGSQGSNMQGIGEFCHEYAHTLGIPDFYDVDYEENGETNALSFLSLMSTGSYCNDSRTPPYLTYEERHLVGWDDGLVLITDGENSLQPIADNKAYWYPTGTEGEYYLFESRPATGWDRYIGGKGLAIYHVDKSSNITPLGHTAKAMWNMGMINACSEHQCMDLVESVTPEPSYDNVADCFFPGTHNVREFSATTKPSFVSWSGHAVGYSLKNISFDSRTGVTTFNATSGTRMLYGKVTNRAGEPLEGAEITISLAESKASASGVRRAVKAAGAESGTVKCTADADGRFQTEVQSSGMYLVSISKEGYMDCSSYVKSEYITTEATFELSTPVEQAGTELRKYQSLDNVSSMGFDSGKKMFIGMKFSASELAGYVGQDITSVSFLLNNEAGKDVREMGVRVYFGNELQCSKAADEHVFGSFCTVDISEFGLTVPEGKSVTFCYYLYDCKLQYAYMFCDGDLQAPDGDLYSENPTGGWGHLGWGNYVIKATVLDREKLINNLGFNYIPCAESYKPGDSFALTLCESASNRPSSVSWTVDGQPASGSVTLTEGTHVIRALLTYPSGRKETIESRIIAK